MAEPKRLESVLPPEAADRDSRSEALLVDGLDRYFAGKYEDAIHLWTRVLFLDRSHARARAYIDRARGAIAERQRQTEEMLHAIGALLAEGQIAQARDLLTKAVAANADDERVAALSERLERLERATPGPVERPPAAAVVDVVPIYAWGARQMLPLALAAALAVAAVMVVGPAVAAAFGWNSQGQGLTTVVAKNPLPVLSTAEAAMLRARTLYARGRLAEALVALDRVDAEHALRNDADRLRVEIQQILLAAGESQVLSR